MEYAWLLQRNTVTTGCGGCIPVARANDVLVGVVLLAGVAQEDCHLGLGSADSDAWLALVVHKHAWEGGALVQLAMACGLGVHLSALNADFLSDWDICGSNTREKDSSNLCNGLHG